MVLLGRKIRVVVDMRGGKLDFSREKNHGCSLILPIGELRRSTPGLSIGFFPLHGFGGTPKAQLRTAPRRARNKRWGRMGNGYEPDQNRSWFGGRSRARLLGKPEKDTSALRHSTGAVSQGALTPPRQLLPHQP